MSTMLHQLRRERVRLTQEQETALHRAVRRLLLEEIHEVRVVKSGSRIRIEQNSTDQAQSV